MGRKEEIQSLIFSTVNYCKARERKYINMDLLINELEQFLGCFTLRMRDFYSSKYVLCNELNALEKRLLEIENLITNTKYIHLTTINSNDTYIVDKDFKPKTTKKGVKIGDTLYHKATLISTRQELFNTHPFTGTKIVIEYTPILLPEKPLKPIQLLY